MVGEQRLLIFAASTLVVSIAIAVGFSLFKSNAVASNREELTSRLLALGAKAQIYFKKPATMSGGGGSFKDFRLTSSDTGDAIGSYSCPRNEPRNTRYVRGSMNPVRSTGSKVFILGCGKETGNNQRDVVKAYAVVTQGEVKVKILN